MKRKTAILTIAYLGAAIGLPGVYASLRKLGEENAERSSRHAGEYAFEELCAASEALSDSLEKGSLTTSPGLEATLCASPSPPWRRRDALFALEEESLALIASPGGEEKLCLCFRCRSGEDRECLVYCSAATGAQERIELLRET